MPAIPCLAVFQSTLSVRRATVTWRDTRFVVVISIHALREESDSRLMAACAAFNRFQSTLSVRRATPEFVRLVISRLFQSTLSVRRATRTKQSERFLTLISIHALREESDQQPILRRIDHGNFNPRSP